MKNANNIHIVYLIIATKHVLLNQINSFDSQVLLDRPELPVHGRLQGTGTGTWFLLARQPDMM